MITLCSFLLVLICARVFPALPTTSFKTECELYNQNSCRMGKGVCNGTETCPEPEEVGKRSHCYAYWSNVSGQVEVIMKGCWLDYQACYDRTTCIEDNPAKDKYFCCCEGDFCNSVVHLSNAHLLTEVPGSPMTSSPGLLTGSSTGGIGILHAILMSLLPLLLVTVLIIFVFWLWSHWKVRRGLNQLSPSESPSLLSKHLPASPKLIQRDIDLLELKGHGRYSTVWKARLAKSSSVAVKIYPEHDRQSWVTESDFYSQPLIAEHGNILRFIGTERRGSELWLITEYHEIGSLYDYLKSNTVTKVELVSMAMSMCRGLSFLHSSIGSKPPVAHRDIKSRNILLRHDMTTCIADFGLALTLTNNPGDTHGQVGTHRYMAPEVLDGSINFSIECFVKIDVYACALVLWELLSRCITDKGSVDSYSMPFEDLVGLHPTLEDMQNVVVNQKMRPQLSDNWHQDEHLSSLCITIEESWDQDPEARLSAECIDARLAVLEESLMSSCVNSFCQQQSVASPPFLGSVNDVSSAKINALLQLIVDKTDISSSVSSKTDEFASQNSIEKSNAVANMTLPHTSTDRLNVTLELVSSEDSCVSSMSTQPSSSLCHMSSHEY